MSEIWLLHHAEQVVAELHVTEPDFPWLRGTVVRHEGFAAVAGLFAEEVRLLDVMDDEFDAWTAACDRIRATTRLTNAEGHDVPEYLLHIDGDEAWWRWSDEPFEEG